MEKNNNQHVATAFRGAVCRVLCVGSAHNTARSRKLMFTYFPCSSLTAWEMKRPYLIYEAVRELVYTTKIYKLRAHQEKIKGKITLGSVAVYKIQASTRSGTADTVYGRKHEPSQADGHAFKLKMC